MSTGCQKDMPTERQMDRQTDDRQTERQTDFSAQLSKQKYFRMSKGCQSISQTDRKIYRAPGRQCSVTERQNDSMADSRAAKEPALVKIQLVQVDDQMQQRVNVQ